VRKVYEHAIERLHLLVQTRRSMEDVIIIGGGPVGMICALGLAQAGVRVRVIEAEPQIIDSPRAAVYFWSVLAGLGRLGILQEADAAGVRKQDYTYLVRRSGERIVYSMEILTGHTPHPYNLHLGQHRLADIAMRRLKAFSNATVRFGTRLQKLHQDVDGVTLSVATEHSTEELRARWVIGADGAGSTVRRLLGLSFDGITWPERFVATNVYYDFERHGYARATFVIDDGFGAVIAILNNEDLWRCTYMEDATLPEETFLERLPQMYQAILPGEGSYQLERASPYRMHQRSAPRYRVGRVLLAGDAAHITNPTGGLGLTAGLFDSYALYPALAAVVLEGADDEVLDRYSATRLDIFLNRVSPQAIANKQLIYHANGGGRKLEEALASLRRLATDPEFLWQRLMFTKSLETPLLGHVPL
jgi:2-polyprenyl-6-methoxyphenol hydroxylase-like FAD-dependent oxidoreductase